MLALQDYFQRSVLFTLVTLDTEPLRGVPLSNKAGPRSTGSQAKPSFCNSTDTYLQDQTKGATLFF